MNKYAGLTVGLAAAGLIVMALVAKPFGESSETKQQVKHQEDKKAELVKLTLPPSLNFSFRFEIPPENNKNALRMPANTDSDNAFIKSWDEAAVKGICSKSDQLIESADNTRPVVIAARLTSGDYKTPTELENATRKMRSLAEESSVRLIALITIIFEGRLAKNSTSVPDSILAWGSVRGLQSNQIANAFFSGIRRELTGNQIKCGTNIVRLSRKNDGNSFVTGLYAANREYLNKINEYTVPVTKIVRGEFEKASDFEERKLKEKAEMDYARAAFDKDKESISVSVIRDALSAILPPLRIKDVSYDADRQTFAAVLTASGSDMNIPFTLASPSEQAPKDKEALLANDTDINYRIALLPDGELVIKDFLIRTKTAFYLAKTEWKPGFRFGPESEILYSKVLADLKTLEDARKAREEAQARKAREEAEANRTKEGSTNISSSSANNNTYNKSQQLPYVDSLYLVIKGSMLSGPACGHFMNMITYMYEGKLPDNAKVKQMENIAVNAEKAGCIR